MYISNQGKIMRKLLGKPTAESPGHDDGGGGMGFTSSPAAAAYRPTSQQNITYDTGVPIACFDRSPDGRWAILAGRHILRTVSMDGLYIREGVDLRGLITGQATARTGTTWDQLSIRDVKWGGGQSEASVFTACGNGKIFHYDVARLGASAADGTGIDAIQMREDSRQINTLDVNPHRGSLLLSGSQDGIVRCFDIRAPMATRTGLTFRASLAFKCNADSVRHVQWSPKDAFFFACATDAGLVLRWDIRRTQSPAVRINAHSRPCTSLSWHPDGVHLISAGWDARCHVWDVTRNPDPRQKPARSIHTPAPVAAVAWRPGQWSATARGRRAAQVAVSYDESTQRRFGIDAVHIWDLARPTMPYKEIVRFDRSPSALLWHDQDLLWTAGQDGLFNQCDVAFAPKVIDRTSVSSLAFSSRGEALVFLDERAPVAAPPRPRLPAMVHQQQHPHQYQHQHQHQRQPSHQADESPPPTLPLPLPPPPTLSFSSSPTTPVLLSTSHSDSEDDVLGSFVGPARRLARRPSLHAARSTTHAFSTTPPSSGGPGPPAHRDLVVPLDECLDLTGSYLSHQAMATGPLPAAARVDVYHYLSTNYLETLETELPLADADADAAQSSTHSSSLPERVAKILHHYAAAAENVRQFRLAQTWRVLAYSTDLLLRRRAQYHLERRAERLAPRPPPDRRARDSRARADSSPWEAPTPGDQTPRRAAGPGSSGDALGKSVAARSLLSEEIESTSNVATPLVRPVLDDLPPLGGWRHEADVASASAHHGQHPRYMPGKKLTPVLESDGFVLPPAGYALHVGSPRRRYDSIALSDASRESENTEGSSTEGYDFYDADNMTKAIDVPQAKKQKDVYGDARSPANPPHPQRRHHLLARQDTDDSLQAIFAISQSSDGRSNSSSRDSSFPSASFHHDAGPQMGSSQSGPPATALAMPTLPGPAADEEYRMYTQTTSGSAPSEDYDYYSKMADSSYPQTNRADVAAPRSQVSDDDDNNDEKKADATVIQETDFLPWPDDPPYPHPLETELGVPVSPSGPLHPHTVLSRALSFEMRSSSAHNAAAMILLLKPLVSDDVIDPFLATAILRQYHSRLMSMRLFIEATLLRKLCVKGWPGGVLDAWGENYNSVFSQAKDGVSAAFLCPYCYQVREMDRSPGSTDSVWRCERCEAVAGPCAVCGHRDETPNLLPGPPAGPDKARLEEEEGEVLKGDHGGSTVLSTWWYCGGCGHGGHSTCLQGWHSSSFSSVGSPGGAGSPLIGSPPTCDSSPSWGAPADSGPAAAGQFLDGCCPMDGCGHACLPGRYRTELARSRSEEISRVVVRETTRSTSKASSASSGGRAGGERDRRFSLDYGYGGGGVHGDGFDVGQSRAVESVRESLAAAAASDAAAAGELLARRFSATSPGRTGADRERERRKSVKFVPTDEWR